MGMISIEGHTFDESLLDYRSIVVDVGANIGDFSYEVLSRFGCYVEAYEPSIPTFLHMQTRVLTERFIPLNRAVAGTTGIRVLHMESPYSQSNSLEPSHSGPRNEANASEQAVYTVSLSSIIQRLGKIDLLKLDCEGSELEIIRETSPYELRRIRQICIEFHEFCVADQSPEMVEACMRKLHESGFEGPTRFERAGMDDCRYLNPHW